MTFSKIERLIGGDLPRSAHKHRAWWSNNPSNSVITRAWLSAGYKSADVSLICETITFVKQRTKRGKRPALGAFSEVISIAPGYDLTKPTAPGWGSLDD